MSLDRFKNIDEVINKGTSLTEEISDIDLKLKDFPVANFVTTNTFFLGTSPVITPKQIIYILDVVEEFMRGIK